MTPEMAKRVAEAIRKYDAGEPLTEAEWVLVSFTILAAGCSSCGR